MFNDLRLPRSIKKLIDLHHKHKFVTMKKTVAATFSIEIFYYDDVINDTTYEHIN